MREGSRSLAACAFLVTGNQRVNFTHLAILSEVSQGGDRERELGMEKRRSQVGLECTNHIPVLANYPANARTEVWRPSSPIGETIAQRPRSLARQRFRDVASGSALFELAQW